MCHLYGPDPTPRHESTEEDRRRATEWIRSAYAPKGEDARRLARYPEAIELLRELVEFTPLADSDDGYCEVYNRIEAFLADEPAERGEGGVG